jgi:hypothetical protein
MLRAGFTDSFGPANQDDGDAQAGRLKSGPKVQPVSIVALANAVRRAVLRFVSLIIIRTNPAVERGSANAKRRRVSL